MDTLRTSLPTQMDEVIFSMALKMEEIKEKQDYVINLMLSLFQMLSLTKPAFIQHPNQDLHCQFPSPSRLSPRHHPPSPQPSPKNKHHPDPPFISPNRQWERPISNRQNINHWGREEEERGREPTEDMFHSPAEDRGREPMERREVGKEKEEEYSINRSKFGISSEIQFSQMELIDEQEGLFQEEEQEDKEGHQQQEQFPHDLPNPYHWLDIDQPNQVLAALAPHFQLMNLKFAEALKVYSFPDRHPRPMEDILDKNNVLILMKLERSKQIIGAFTEVGFSSKPVRIPRDNPRSFLCNLSQEHFLFASKTNKTHSVDRNYLMFGNWEIRMQVGEKELYSDAGKKGGCFMRETFGGREVQGDPRLWLFGEEHRQQIFGLEQYGIYVCK